MQPAEANVRADLQAANTLKLRLNPIVRLEPRLRAAHQKDEDGENRQRDQNKRAQPYILLT